ncbi:hypothetical protein ACLOJK_036059 [Asimina triloba]
MGVRRGKMGKGFRGRPNRCRREEEIAATRLGGRWVQIDEEFGREEQEQELVDELESMKMKMKIGKNGEQERSASRWRSDRWDSWEQDVESMKIIMDRQEEEVALAMMGDGGQPRGGSGISEAGRIGIGWQGRTSYARGKGVAAL